MRKIPLLVVSALIGGCGYHLHSDGVHAHSSGEVHSEELEEQLAKNRAMIEVKGDIRTIEANGIADHETGAFPNRGNPNSIREQNYVFKVPAKPKAAGEFASGRRGSLMGVAINGVPFDPGTAEFWNRDPGSGWNYEAIAGKDWLGIDLSNAHVQPNGAYHYHGIPIKLLARLGGPQKFVLVGWAADGFPIYGPFAPENTMDQKSTLKKLKSSYRIRKGQRSEGPGGTYDGTFVADYEYVKGLGDLDEGNGRFGKTPEFPDGTYYYVLTETFPYIPRLLRGTPDPSFRKGPPGFGPPPEK